MTHPTVDLDFLGFNVVRFDVRVKGKSTDVSNVVNSHIDFKLEGNSLIVTFTIRRDIIDEIATCVYETTSAYKLIANNVQMRTLIKDRNIVPLLAELEAVSHGHHYGAFHERQKGTPINDFVYPIRPVASFQAMIIAALQMNFN